ncbi:ABC transporter permease [Micromonospora sp. NPDC049523]|uniref:ABC transporter permease n=1 Tax=Micromonospora sp. NPDC049523 TaxID=3155921 RepID=UPI0034207D37
MLRRMGFRGGRWAVRRTVRQTLGVRAPRLPVTALLKEAFVSVHRHPGRSVMTAIGTILGSAAFVATLGLGSTLEQQVSSSFDVRRATEVLVRPDDKALDPSWQGPDGLERLRRLNGVEAAGRRLALGERPVSRAIGVAGQGTNVIGTDPDGLTAMSPRLLIGRPFDEFHERNAVPVVLLSNPVAERLDIARIGVAVFINDRAFTVMGIFDDVQRRPEALLAALIPASAAETLLTDRSTGVSRDVVIATAPGAAQVIGAQAALSLWPQAPAALQVVAPPDPRTLRREVEASVQRSSMIVSIIALAIGALSIGNSATAAITARTAEIGLRRAVGARPRHIVAQLLAETTALGGFGGAVGALIGVMITVGVSLWNSWQPVIDLRVALVAAAVGAVVGLLAGLWPAGRAIRVQPVAALQR